MNLTHLSKYLKKYSAVIVLSIMLTVSIGVPSFIVSLFFDTYPDQVYSLISFHLNGETKDSLSADLRTYNPINDTYVENSLLRQIIEQDILWLEEEHSDLDLVISKYQNTYPNGSIDVILENTEYDDRKKFRSLRELIYENEDRFWYINNVEQTKLPEDSYGSVNAYTTPCAFSSRGSNRAYLGFRTYILTDDDSWNSDAKFTSNGTMFPTWFVSNGTHWVFNEALNETIYQEIVPLEKIVEGLELISIDMPYSNEVSINNRYELFELNETMDRYTAQDFGNVDFYVSFSAKSNREFRIKLKILETHLLNHWYINGFYDMGCEDWSGFGLIFIGLPVAFVGLILSIVFIILILKQVRKIRKKLLVPSF